MGIVVREVEEHGNLAKTMPCPRSLTTMLADSGNSAVVPEVKKTALCANERELEGCSMFISMDQNHEVSPTVFLQPEMGVVASDNSRGAPRSVRSLKQHETNIESNVVISSLSRLPNVNSGGGCQEFLADLFPTGVSSRGLSLVEELPKKGISAPVLTATKEEAELKGSQEWTCLVSTEASTLTGHDHARESTTSREHQVAIPTKELLELPSQPTPSPPTVSGEALNPTHAGNMKPNDAMTVSSTSIPSPTAASVLARAAGGSAVPKYDNSIHSSNGTQPVAAARVVVREREEELKLALDRLVPRLLDRDKRVSGSV